MDEEKVLVIDASVVVKWFYNHRMIRLWRSEMHT